MPAQSLVISCSSTPQAVAGAFTEGVTAHGVIRVLIKPLSGTAYLGSSSVTTGGYPLTTTDTPITATLYQGDTLWVASSSGATASVAVLRLNETT